MSKKCCKSYKEGKACKKCPRFHDWNYLMSWKPTTNPKTSEWENGYRVPFRLVRRAARIMSLEAGHSANPRSCLTTFE